MRQEICVGCVLRDRKVYPDRQCEAPEVYVVEKPSGNGHYDYKDCRHYSCGKGRDVARLSIEEIDEVMFDGSRSLDDWQNLDDIKLVHVEGRDDPVWVVSFGTRHKPKLIGRGAVLFNHNGLRKGDIITRDRDFRYYLSPQNAYGK